MYYARYIEQVSEKGMAAIAINIGSIVVSMGIGWYLGVQWHKAYEEALRELSSGHGK